MLADAPTPPQTIRIALVILGLGIWHLTQSLIKNRPSGTGVIGDGIHAFTARAFAFFTSHPAWADRLLIVSTLAIDALGTFVLVESIVGPSIRPFLGLILLFGLRQVCQALTALPPPEGMIWRSPGVPSLLVTYGVSNDLFFSGHTALAVYGAIELGRWGGPIWATIGAAVALFETAVVLVLRAHYTMDVFTGAVTAFAAAVVADRLAPGCDAALVKLGTLLFGT
ncbi:MAG TPA: phosphatase PAP2-related protein [Gemmataceae bacterium]|nr:phosphatase PAP2-related protein [Gemmataceae bacterium]